PLCLIVRRVPQKPVGQWEALFPPYVMFADFQYMDGGPVAGSLDEGEAWTWVRMDLRLAVEYIKRYAQVVSGLKHPSLDWDPYSATTSTASSGSPLETPGPSSAPSTESPDPA